jgi:hypothetical protein
MNDTPFGGWTRRRLGSTAGSLLVAIHAITGSAVEAARKSRAKRKRKKPRRRPGGPQTTQCLAVRRSCAAGDPRQTCCSGLTCAETLLQEGTHCCRQITDACAETTDCCSPHLCDAVAGQAGRRCCLGSLASCTADAECCGDLRCGQAFILEGNRCCAAVGAPCRTDLDCCDSGGVLCDIATSRCAQVA